MNCIGKNRENKINIKQLLSSIPEDLLSKLAAETKVDYCTKVLYGKYMFYLLLYGVLRPENLSLRYLAETFKSPFFRILFNVEGHEGLAHSSLSDRLRVIPLDFFSRAYGSIYKLFSHLYTPEEIKKVHLERVDSTLVVEASQKLKEGLDKKNGSEKSKKMVKYTMVYDGEFTALSELHLDSPHTSEELALKEAVYSHFKKAGEKSSSIYIIDRGLASAETFKSFTKQGIKFVGRLSDNRKRLVVKDLLEGKGTCVFDDGSRLLEDKIVKLYKKVTTISKKGKESHKAELVDSEVRIVRIHPADKKESYSITFITDILDMTAEQIAGIYRRRWDIEVFYRFIKQELNFKHLLSMDSNGIRVMMYMTLIAAMLVMIYKKLNNVSFSTSKKHIVLELEELIVGLIILEAGGDINKSRLAPS